MARGIINGIVTGLLLVLALFAICALTLAPGLREAPVAQVAEQSAPEVAVPEVQPDVAPEAEAEPEAEVEAEVAQAAGPEVMEPEAVDPEASEPEADMPAAQAESQSAAPEPEAEPAPVAEEPAPEALDDLPLDTLDAPEVTAPETAVVDDEAPRAEPVPLAPLDAPVDATAPEADARPAVPVDPTPPETGTDPAAPAEATEGDAPRVAGQGAAPVVMPEAQPPQPEAAAPAPATGPTADAAPAQPAPEPEPEPVPEPEPAPAPEMIIVENEAPDEGADEPRPGGLGAPVVPFTDRAEGVVTGRLPSIEAAPAPAEADESAEALAVPGQEGLAILRNATPFSNPARLPTMSIVLADSGPERAQIPGLDALPFPVTFKVDADAPDAAEAIAFYRSIGAEVIVLTPLPQGASPVDVDQAMQAYDPLLDEAVAVMMEEDLGFQTLGAGAEQVATNLAERGLGLLSFPAGLNTGHRAALQLGVPAGLVFTDLDGEGQAPAVIRRFVDNAAFRARNEAGVVLYARVRPETIQALMEWRLGSRAETVTLAPLSWVLFGE